MESSHFGLTEISTTQVWPTLQNRPYQLYLIKGIDWTALGIGEPMLTSKPWLDPVQIREAKILVEVKEFFSAYPLVTPESTTIVILTAESA